jgi:hypothetical protein
MRDLFYSSDRMCPVLVCDDTFGDNDTESKSQTATPRKPANGVDYKFTA